MAQIPFEQYNQADPDTLSHLSEILKPGLSGGSTCSAAARPRASVIRRNMRLSCLDGMVVSAFTGLGESNFVLFALSLGLGPVIGGLVCTVPPLIGSLVQLLSPVIIGRLGSYKKWVCICSFIQAVSILLLVASAGTQHARTLLLFASVSLYWGAGFGAGIGFTTMIAEMVPASVRPRYFAIRTKWGNATLVTTTIATGIMLEYGRVRDAAIEVFIIFFVAAPVIRIISLFAFLRRHVEHTPIPANHRKVPLAEFLTRFRQSSGGRLLTYMLAMQLAIQIFTPYLNPYLFVQLGLSRDFVAIAFVNGAQITAKMLFLPLVGRIAAREGSLKLLSVAGLAVIPLPLLWAVSTAVPYLIVVQLISGLSLVAYEMAVLLRLFEMIPNGERTSVMVRYLVLSQAATMLGSFIGAGVLEGLGNQPEAYTALFAVSTVFRSATVVLLRRVVVCSDSPSSVAGFRAGETVQLRLHPANETMDEPLLESLSDF